MGRQSQNQRHRFKSSRGLITTRGTTWTWLPFGTTWRHFWGNFGRISKALPNAKRNRGLGFAYEIQSFRPYHKFWSWSNFTFRISTKHQQNLNQASVFPLNLNFKILTKPSLRISTKIQLHNLYKTSAEKNWPSSSCKFCLNFNFNILTKPCAQSLNKSLAFWPNLSLQICNKLLPTRSSSATVTQHQQVLSWHLHRPGLHQSSLLNRSQWVSEWVSQWVTSIADDRTRVP